MGAFAMYADSEVSIGTCEDMYYLRADQAHLVTAIPGNVDPVRHRAEIRFRFPFPDEDGKAPGDFDDYDRGVRVDGAAREVMRRFDPADHDRIQFTAHGGYLVSLPCPEIAAKDDTFSAGEGILTLTDGSEHAYRVGRNGFRGALFVKQQKHVGHLLVTVIACACGAKWRLETLEQAEPVIVALRSMADHEASEFNRFRDEQRARFYHDMADRIAAGYGVTADQPAGAAAS